MQFSNNFLFSFILLFILLLFPDTNYTQIHYYTNLKINGSQENPPTSSTALGIFNGWYDESTMMLGFTVTFEGLSSNTSAAHFHGPAHPDSNAGVIIGWTGFPTGVTSGTFSDTIMLLNATMEAQLLSGRWYANIHTSTFPGGEIRGQLFETSPIHSYTNLLMSGSQEVPPNGSAGTAIFNGWYNESTNMLGFIVSFQGLSSGTSAAHFHGPAPSDSNAGVQIGWTGFPTGVMSGAFSDTVTLTEVQEDQLLAGRWYANIHSSVFPAGEIRTQLYENPTLDGSFSDPMYIEIADKQNLNAGFGSNIDVNRIVYYADTHSSTLYLGFEGKLNTGSNDGIGFWLGFDELAGVPAGTALGGSPGGHYMGGNGGANPNFRADFEVDYMFAVNPGGGAADVFFDAVKLVGVRTAQYLGSTNQSGTAAGNLNSGFFSANSVWFSFNNDGALNNGFEMGIPFNQLGVTSMGEVTAFAFVTSSSGFFSDVTVPGSVTGGNPGFDVNFSTLAGGPYNSGSAPLPVELTSFTASIAGKSVTLKWITASEINNHGFEIQRSTLDNEWVTVGFKEGNGTSSEQNNYSFTDNIPHLSAYKISYRLKQIDFNGNYSFSNAVDIVIEIPDGFVLEQNYPNPFNPSTLIKFMFDKETKAQLKVFDILGNEVAELFNETTEAGKVYEINFNASELSSGVYYYRLTGNGKAEIKKMMLLK